MNKKVLVAAIGAALVAGPIAAQAATTVYGHMHVSIDMFDTGGTDGALPNQKADGIGIVSNSSRFGVKGSEDLGGGLKATYQAEFGFNADENGATNQRNTFGGLAGGFGEVRVGRHDTPYKMATGKLDPFSETVGDYNSMLGNIGGGFAQLDLRADNTVLYLSPKFGGFSVAAAYAQGPYSLGTSVVGVAIPGSQANGADAQDNSLMSVSGAYDAGPLFVSVAYEKHDLKFPFLGVPVDLSFEGLKIGAGYTIGGFKLGAVYETQKGDVSALGASADIVDTNRIWLTGSGNFGNNQISVSYGIADETISGLDDGAKQLSVGWFHNFSKTARTYVVYTNVSNDTNGSFRYGDSGHGDLLSAVTGQDNSAISIGAIIDF